MPWLYFKAENARPFTNETCLMRPLQCIHYKSHRKNHRVHHSSALPSKILLRPKKIHDTPQGRKQQLANVPSRRTVRPRVTLHTLRWNCKPRPTRQTKALWWKRSDLMVHDLPLALPRLCRHRRQRHGVKWFGFGSSTGVKTIRLSRVTTCPHLKLSSSPKFFGETLRGHVARVWICRE